MVSLLLVLLSVLASLLGGLFLLGAFRQQRPGEPPLDKGPIPWLGHLLEFHRDTEKFLLRMRQKHGDIFTVQLGGFYVTFLMDALSFGMVTKEARTKLDFNTFANHLVARVFSYEGMENDHESLLLCSNKHLKGDGLVPLTEAIMSNLQNVMLHSHSSEDSEQVWVEDGLLTYSYSTVFRAGYLALFGNETSDTSEDVQAAEEADRKESLRLYYEFRKLDQLFPKLASGVLPPWDKMSAERLKRFFWSALSVTRIKTKYNVSGWVRDLLRDREETGMKVCMQDRFILLLLWASQGNTGPAAFWVLLYLMKHPAAMRAVKAEVEQVLKESGQEVRCGGPLVSLTRQMLLKMPIMDSAVQETLRLVAMPLLTRAVMQNMKLKMADGCEYCLRGGDRLALFPYIAIQIDPDIHPDPLSFKYDRFLNLDGSKKKDFYKAGRKVRYSTMPWGAGVSMCPGRFFATNELKQFVFLMLLYFDFELKNPEEEVPGIDLKRLGFGAMQPSRDVQFRYRLRF